MSLTLNRLLKYRWARWLAKGLAVLFVLGVLGLIASALCLYFLGARDVSEVMQTELVIGLLVSAGVLLTYGVQRMLRRLTRHED